MVGPDMSKTQVHLRNKDSQQDAKDEFSPPQI